MPSSRVRFRIGLAANRAHQDDPGSALVRLLRDGQEAIATLRPHFIVVGRILDAIERHGLLPGAPAQRMLASNGSYRKEWETA